MSSKKIIRNSTEIELESENSIDTNSDAYGSGNGVADIKPLAKYPYIKSNGYSYHQISRKLDKDNECYEYVYEIHKDNKVVGTKRTLIKTNAFKYRKYNSEDDSLIVEVCNKYFEDNHIKIVNLFKNVNLKKHLKPLHKHILETKSINITQAKIEELIKRYILKNIE